MVIGLDQNRPRKDQLIDGIDLIP
jgi:hypothetical protein